MRKTFSLAAVICALMLQGCLVTPTGAAADASVLQGRFLDIPERDHGSTLIKQLEFSPDGRHFLLTGGIGYVDLYDTESGAVVWSLDKIEAIFMNAGFIDDETFFIGMRFYEDAHATNSRENVRRLSIRKVSTPDHEEEAALFPDGRSYPMIANGNFVYYDAQLLDRRDGRIHPVVISHLSNARGRLTRSGKVLTEVQGQAVLYDYATEDYLHWCADCRPSIFTRAGGAYDITASERFVVTYSLRGDCYAWALPTTESIGRCGYSSLFRTETPVVRAHPVRDRVAVAWGPHLQVYDLDPFRKVFEQRLDGRVTGIALSNGSTLAAALPGGRILVWNLDDGRLLGQHDLDYEDRFSLFNDRLAFSPDGRQLLTGFDAPILLEIPQ